MPYTSDMTKKPTTLDDIFNEVEAEAAAQPVPPPLTPEQLADREAESAALHAKGVRLGWHDEDGNPIDEESDEDDEEESE